MFNLKISGLAMLLASTVLISSSTNAAATIKTETNLVCTNFSYNPKCNKKTKPITHTKKIRKTKTAVVESDRPYLGNLRTEIAPGVFVEAARYTGFSEITDTKSLQALTGVNPRRTKWCAAFLNAILNRKGYRTSGGNTAASFRNYGVKVSNPVKGDIVVLHGHVGIFVKYTTINGRKMVAVLGGNQSNKVKISYYPAKRIITIRRPIV